MNKCAPFPSGSSFRWFPKVDLDSADADVFLLPDELATAKMPSALWPKLDDKEQELMNLWLEGVLFGSYSGRLSGTAIIEKN